MIGRSDWWRRTVAAVPCRFWWHSSQAQNLLPATCRICYQSKRGQRCLEWGPRGWLYCADWSASRWCHPPTPKTTMQLASALLPAVTCEPLHWREPTHPGLSNKLCTQPCPDQGWTDVVMLCRFFFPFLCLVDSLNSAPPMLSFTSASCERSTIKKE